jgi:predicted ArsR family transcriptional regulator
MERKRKAGTDSTRLRMMELMSNGAEWTAKELAAELGLGPNSLYHHLRVLEDAVLIEKAGTRAPGRMVETTYRLTTAADQQLTWELDENLALLFTALLEAAKADVQESVYAAAKQVEAGDALPWGTVLVEAPSFVTTAAEVAEFQKRLKRLLTEFRRRAAALPAESSGRTTMKFTYALRDRPLVQAR